VLVKDLSNVRKMMPYLMQGRNESAVYHEQIFDLTKTRPWLRAYNRANSDAPATLFHLLTSAFAEAFHARPGLNRFIAGGRIYQRNEVALSFAAKKTLDDAAPLVTVKMKMPRNEPFAEFTKRMAATINDSRSDRLTTVDKELKLALALPGPVVSGVMGLLRGLDSVNLMPSAMIESDPMYATAFLGNLGSVGIDNTYHHLYEYGTISFFGCIGTTSKRVVVGRDGQPTVRDTVSVRWTFDERVNDGYYCAKSLKVAQQVVEDPERFHGAMPGVQPTVSVADQAPTSPPGTTPFPIRNRG
jgi:pyruvate/2-oxoglutarate dehydrogenase complex dihydrolipoamide acyltransferase (E2) component